MISSRTLGVMAAVLAVVTGLLAQRSVLPGEVGVAEWLNGLPVEITDVFVTIMRLGERDAVLVVALAAAVLAGRRALRASLVVVAAAALAWFGCAALDDTVERPAPSEASAEVVPDTAATSGWPAAEAAIATAALSAAALAVSRKPGLAIIAGGLVGLSGVGSGVHLPLDAVAGVAVGITAAVIVTELMSAAPRPAKAPTPAA